MFNAIVRFSVRKKLFVGLTTLFLFIGGIYAMLTLPIDAVPDITNNQVQIVTVSPTLAPQEVEQLITMPIEIAMSNIMNVEEIRSVSRFGLSLVTVVFKESVPTLDARQLINEQIQAVSGEIPTELGTPELMPITTGLGEIYQYILEVNPKYRDKYDAMELRTIQDWIVKRQLSGIPGIVEINSFGGNLKQYEVAVDPDALYSLHITIGDVFEALNKNNQNTGGSYIEKVNKAYYIRSEGMISSLKDIEKIVIANRNGIPVHVNDVATVRFGSAKRFGAMTMDGKGECVGGIAMMLKGANANVVTKELEARVSKVQKMLPEGISIEPYLNRSELVNRNISTVVRNLIEGALIVFLVLIIFLGNVRAGLIVASVIPLAMLFAFIMMRVFNVSANLMSLGAIDFGIVVDGSIVILEGILAHIYSKRFRGHTFTREEMDEEVEKGIAGVVRSATFAVLIILIVFFPILTLTGIEGKYFTPMAKTLVFCIIGALILSLTYVPMMASLFLKRTISVKTTFADRFFERLNKVYKKCLGFCMRHIKTTVATAFIALATSLILFTKLGAEFIPTLDEGDFAMQMTLPAGSSLTQSIEMSSLAQKTLMDKFPEIKHVVAKIGTAEVPTDPMAVEDANANVVTKELEARVSKVQKMLPEGISIEPYLNRSELVNRNISTVVRNLIEGALIVFLVLIIFLGNVRAGLIVASVIPLAMLFAFIMMRVFNVSANLMSLGAIDFGIVVDGSIVILEGILAHIYSKRFRGHTFTREEMDEEVEKGIAGVVRSATFAVLIILIVFFPILTLTGIEGKYFTPMAKTLVFCIIGALILSLTYVPMMASLFLKRTISVKTTFADRFFERLNKVYKKCLGFCMRHIKTTVATAFIALATSLILFTKLGAEFIPTLDEGDFAMQMTLPAGSSLTQSIEMSSLAQKTLMDKFPEIKHVVAKIGTAEVPTDPMAVEDADVMIIMKPFKEWTSASSRAEMVDKMKAALEPLSDRAEFNFSQPIQLRFNELMTGAKADIAIKLYGEDTHELYERAKEAAKYVEKVSGASDVIVEQTMGLPQLVVEYDRGKIARYGMNIEELNTIIRTAYAGEAAGVVFENERRFDLVLRLDNEKVADLNLDKLFVRTGEGVQIPVSEVAKIDLVNGPLQINRDETKRRIVIGVNVRDADIQQVVGDIRATLDKNIKLKPGYYFSYGGQFENLQNAINTLLIVIPVALALILLLLFFAFKSVTYSLVVFSTVPLSLIGGILALWLRGLPFSISAGVGFIALFGVAVLNGILMINHFNEKRLSSKYHLTTSRIIRKSCPELLRPVFLTGLVASLGFVPMAIATSAGAEVQRPLATVVIGGLIVSTILTLIIIPVFYHIVNSTVMLRRKKYVKWFSLGLFSLLLLCVPVKGNAQEAKAISLDEAVEMAIANSPRLKIADADIKRMRATRGEVMELAPTSFNYSWGQLNGEVKNDKQMELTQSFGSLLTPFYKNALVNKQVATGTYYRRLVEKEITAEVKRAWCYYSYARNLYDMYKEQSELADRLQRAGDLRYRQGDISLLEKSMLNTIASDMKNKLFQAQEELKVAGSRFQWICYTDIACVPAETSIELFPVDMDVNSLSQIHFDYFQSIVQEKKAMLNIERSRFFPEFSLGYVRQDINPVRGLNSWMVGVAFPVWFFPQRSKIRQAKFDTYIARTEADANMRELRNKVIELRSNVNRCLESIRYYTTSALPEADTLMKTANLQFGENDIDVTQYVQSLNAAREIKKGYIDMVYQYNVTVLEYELYK